MKLHKALRALVFLQLCNKKGTLQVAGRENVSTGTSSNDGYFQDYKRKLWHHTRSSQNSEQVLSEERSQSSLSKGSLDRSHNSDRFEADVFSCKSENSPSKALMKESKNFPCSSKKAKRNHMSQKPQSCLE